MRKRRRRRVDIPSVSNSFTGPLRRQSIKLSLSEGNVLQTELRKSDRRDLCSGEKGEWENGNRNGE